MKLLWGAVYVTWATVVYLVPHSNAACGGDPCGRVVSKGPSGYPFPTKVAKLYCSSYLSVTVSQCPTTTVVTVRRNATASTVTEQSTKTATSPLCVTNTEKETVTVEDRQKETVTVTETKTATTSTTEVSRTTNVQTITEPSTYTTTSTTTRTYIVQVSPNVEPAETTITVTKTTTQVRSIITATNPQNQNQRRAQQCTARTTIATRLPAYATRACWARPAYSSACSCLGVTRRTTTLPRRTITQMTTSTNTLKPTTTIVQEITVAGDCRETVTITDTERSTTTVTETATASVETITTGTATTTEVVEAQTTEYSLAGTYTQPWVTYQEAQVTPCPLRQVGGPYSSPPRYLRKARSDSSLVWTNDMAQANSFFLDPTDGTLRTGYSRLLGYESWGPIFVEDFYRSPGEYLKVLQCSSSPSDEISCKWGNLTMPGKFGLFAEPIYKQYFRFGYDPYTGSDPSPIVGLVRECPTYQATITTTSTVTEYTVPTACPLKQVGGGIFGEGGVNYDGTYLRSVGSIFQWYSGRAQAQSFFLDGDSRLASYEGSLAVSGHAYPDYLYEASTFLYDPEANDRYALQCSFVPASIGPPELKCVSLGPGGNNDFKRFRYSPQYLAWGNSSSNANGQAISVKIVRACPEDEA